MRSVHLMNPVVTLRRAADADKSGSYVVRCVEIALRAPGFLVELVLRFNTVSLSGLRTPVEREHTTAGHDDVGQSEFRDLIHHDGKGLGVTERRRAVVRDSHRDEVCAGRLVCGRRPG